MCKFNTLNNLNNLNLLLNLYSIRRGEQMRHHQVTLLHSSLLFWFIDCTYRTIRRTIIVLATKIVLGLGNRNRLGNTNRHGNRISLVTSLNGFLIVFWLVLPWPTIGVNRTQQLKIWFLRRQDRSFVMENRVKIVVIPPCSSFFCASFAWTSVHINN